MNTDSQWYKKEPAKIFKELKTSENGLTNEEVARLLEQYGPNQLPEAKTDGIVTIFFKQFKSPLIYLLLAAAAVVLYIQEYIDGIIILFVLLFNAVVGTIQAGKAQNTLLALRKFTKTSANVLRNRQETIIADTELVPGDIIFLHEGEKIPADARILSSHNLRVSEAALTGESEPVSKHEDIITGDQISLGEQKNTVFKGTHVVAGTAKAVVFGTGLQTVIGNISEKMNNIDTDIPLQTNIKRLSHFIIIGVLVLSTIIFSLGTILGKELEEMFKLSVAIIISAIPEGLPIVMTLLLASGVWRMSKKNVLIKKLQAVEALGEARVIAVDKTGTLTKGELVVQKVYVNDQMYDIEGVGYDVKGNILRGGEKVNFKEDNLLLQAGKISICASDARLSFSTTENKWKVAGDPTEAALSVFGAKVGLSRESVWQDLPQIDDLPFDSIKKYHAVLHRGKDTSLIAVVGAPEVVLDLCSDLDKNKKEELLGVFTDMSAEGLRVLAFATKQEDLQKLKTEHINNLSFGGFYGMQDALKEEVHDAMGKTQAAGIKVVMITGDHAVTAEAIARKAGIFNDGDTVLSGQIIESLTDEELAQKIDNVTVYARVTPEHKLRIVAAYRVRGEIIAMTGDGVNDALSLVAADLGVSMGENGTEVAKEAADIVLLDDNFGSIVSAIEEGRNIYKNIKKVLLFLFSTNLGEIFIIIGAIILQYPLPVVAVQLIWLNLITDGFLDVALALEPKEKGLLKEEFKKPSKWIVDFKMTQRMLIMAITMAIGTLFLFSRYFEADLTKAMTIALTTMAAGEWFKVFNCRSDRKSIFTINPFSNKILVAALILVISLQIAAMHIPFTQNILQLVPLSLTEWFIIIAVAFSIIIVDEVWKFIYRRISA